MLYAALKLVHLLCVIVWLGGMAFAHFFLRPALAELDPPVKARLMQRVLSGFLNTVLVLSTLTVASGLWMMSRVARIAVQSGAPFNMPIEWWVMAILGVLMWLIFGHIRFVLFKRLSLAVAGFNWSAANQALGQIRHWVLFNLGVGAVIVATTVLLGSS